MAVLSLTTATGKEKKVGFNNAFVCMTVTGSPVVVVGPPFAEKLAVGGVRFSARCVNARCMVKHLAASVRYRVFPLSFGCSLAYYADREAEYL